MLNASDRRGAAIIVGKMKLHIIFMKRICTAGTLTPSFSFPRLRTVSLILLSLHTIREVPAARCQDGKSRLRVHSAEYVVRKSEGHSRVSLTRIFSRKTQKVQIDRTMFASEMVQINDR